MCCNISHSTSQKSYNNILPFQKVTWDQEKLLPRAFLSSTKATPKSVEELMALDRQPLPIAELYKSTRSTIVKCLNAKLETISAGNFTFCATM